MVIREQGWRRFHAHFRRATKLHLLEIRVQAVQL